MRRRSQRNRESISTRISAASARVVITIKPRAHMDPVRSVGRSAGQGASGPPCSGAPWDPRGAHGAARLPRARHSVCVCVCVRVRQQKKKGPE